MAWVPDDATEDIFGENSAAIFHYFYYGGSMDMSTAPHRQEPKIYGCRITEDFEMSDGIRYKKGMEGQFSEMDEEKQMIKVFIMGVTESQGETHRWVPLKFVEKGNRWQVDMSKWKVEERPGVQSFDK
jgi:hypothetical protein